MLEAEVAGLADAARRAGVQIVGGDTKVVEHGKADGMYITTAGIGTVDPRVRCSPRVGAAGDKVLLSGPIGDHGITILLARGEIDLEAELRSDTRSVLPLVERAARRGGRGAALDARSHPRRGGDVAQRARPRLRPRDRALGGEHPGPRRRCAAPASCWASIRCTSPTRGSSWRWSRRSCADAALAALRATPGGEEAVLIGEVREEPARTVLGVASYGGTRVVDMLVGDPLPRIC